MRYPENLILVAALSATCITALPVTTDSIDIFVSNFSIPVTHHALAVNQNDPAAYHKAIARWNVKKDLPTGKALKSNLVLEHHLAKRVNGAGTVQATPGAADIQYTVPVSIGSSAQSLNLNNDTGSADFWVFSSNQPTSQTSGHKVYQPNKSSNYQNMAGSTWSIGYADGSQASGTVAYDSVNISGTTVNKQAIEMAKTVSKSFVSGGNDGLIGLAFGTLNTVRPTRVKTFFENAMSSLQSGLFTAYLRHAAQGSYDFGYIDNSKYNGTIHAYTAIADTGTSLLLTSSAAATAYYKTVPKAQANSQVGGYILPCNSTNAPAFQFNVGPYAASVSGSNIIYGTSLGSINGISYCFGSIQPISGTQLIYGDVFFKQNFAVFDYKNSRFGFAPHAF
ncbi:Penicillopepsin [Arthrobotrys entomopaga]|nr:Penicillopepsin [Arthrobotrys entomopaga]